MRKPVLLLIAVSMFACTSAWAGYEIKDFYPLTLGNTWHFDTEGRTEWVENGPVIGGEAVLQVVADWTQIEAYVTSDARGFLIHGTTDSNGTPIELNSPIVVQPNNFTEITPFVHSTTGTYFGFDFTLTVISEFLGFEEVSLPGDRRFVNAAHFRIEEQTLILGELSTATFQIWLIQNLGEIKTVDESDPLSSRELVSAVTYYASGRKRAEYLEQAMDAGHPAGSFVYLERLDENFGGTGHGRISKRQWADAQYQLIQYAGNTDKISTVTTHRANGQHWMTETYYASGRRRSVVHLNEPENPAVWYYDNGLGYEMVPGDITADGVVDRADVAAFVSNFGRQGDVDWFNGDFDGDQKVTILDLAVIQRHFGETVTPPPAPAPAAAPLVVRAAPRREQADWQEFENYVENRERLRETRSRRSVGRMRYDADACGGRYAQRANRVCG